MGFRSISGRVIVPFAAADCLRAAPAEGTFAAIVSAEWRSAGIPRFPMRLINSSVRSIAPGRAFLILARGRAGCFGLLSSWSGRSFYFTWMDVKFQSFVVNEIILGIQLNYLFMVLIGKSSFSVFYFMQKSRKVYLGKIHKNNNHFEKILL